MNISFLGFNLCAEGSELKAAGFEVGIRALTIGAGSVFDFFFVAREGGGGYMMLHYDVGAYGARVGLWVYDALVGTSNVTKSFQASVHIAS